jgi:hypothetical protein
MVTVPRDPQFAGPGSRRGDGSRCGFAMTGLVLAASTKVLSRVATDGNRLFVSRNTVSSEVGSIYRKLGVSSRHDAVQRATAVGLLGG